MNSAGFLSHSHHPAAQNRCKRQSLIISKRICDFVCRRSAENNLYRSESFRFLQKTNYQFPPDPRKSQLRQNEIEISDNYVEPLDHQEKGKSEKTDSPYFEIEERYNAPYYYSDTIKEPAYCSPHPSEEYGNIIIPPPLGYGLLPDSGRKHGHPTRSATRNSIRSQSSVDTGAGSSSLHSKSSSSEDPLPDHCQHGGERRNHFVSVCHIHHSPTSTITSSPSPRPPDPYHFSTRIIPSSSSSPSPHFLLSTSSKLSSRQSSLAKSKALLSRSVNCLNSLNLALNLHEEEEEEDKQQDHSSLDQLHSIDYPKYAYRWSNLPHHQLPPSPSSLTPSPILQHEIHPPPAKHVEQHSVPSSSRSSPVSSFSSSYVKNPRHSKINKNTNNPPAHLSPPPPPSQHPEGSILAPASSSPIPRLLKRDRLGSNSHYPLARRSLHVIDDALLHFLPHSPSPDQLNQVKSSHPSHYPLPTNVDDPPNLKQDPIQMSTLSSPGPIPIYPSDSSTVSLQALPNLNSTYVQPEKMPSKTRHSKYSLPPGNLHNSSLSLEMQDWFHGLMTRQESEHLLRSTKIGSFLVRNCENATKDLYSLSIKSPKGIIHIRLEPNSRGYYAMADQEFPCVPSLIQHFMQAKLPLKGTDHLQLIFPVITHLL